MLITLLKSLREHKKTSWLTIIFAILEVVFEIVIPLCMSNLIDLGIEAGAMQLVLQYGLALAVFALLQLITGVLAAHTAAQASAGFAANLRSDMYEHVQTFSFSNIDKFSVSSIVTRLTTDVTNIQNAYQMVIRMAIRGPMMMVFSMIVAFQINKEISGIFFIVIPFLGFGLYLIIRKVHPIFTKVFLTYDELNNIVQENLHGIRVVKSYQQQKHEVKKFNTISESIYQGFTKGERYIALNSPLMQFCMYACMLLISWLGAKAIVASGNNAAFGLTTGELTALFTYAIQIMMSLMMLSMVFSMITIARSSGERSAELLNETSDIQNPQQPVMEVKNGNIKFQDARFVYARKAEKPVIDHISMKIASGQVIGIVGGTGSSKTSFVQLIPRLYDVNEGAVYVGDVNVKEYDLDTLRNAVAMVLQKNTLFSGTIEENLRWGNPQVSEADIKIACQLACADEFINTLPDGYQTYIEQGGTNISGGQKQRLCIARALLKHPKILILDDSTSAVDTKTDANIQASFAKAIPDTTKIIIAQRILSIQYADCILVFDDGKLTDMGTHDSLLVDSQIYKEMYETQQKVGDSNA